MPLEIDFLRHFGWHPSWVEQLKRHFGCHFLPIQEKAIRQGKLLEGHPVLVVGPTSCGKGLVGELAGLNQIRQNRPALLVTPTKALARQREEELRRRYGPLGLRVLQSSRDRRESDRDVAEGRYHFAVVVAEKLLALLSQQPQLFSTVGTVVFDEFQILFDEDRGADLELLVTRLLREERLQLIALSAVLEEPQPIASWLKATLLEETERPVELRQGVLCQEKFHYREFNREQEGVESLPNVTGHLEEDLILEGVLYYARRGEMTLVFCAGKDESFAWAERFSRQGAFEPAKEAIEELEQLEDNLATESLRRFLASGVAVHNSDLTWLQRRLVEKAAARGEIRILCSTSTLSEGVNLPIVNTFIPRTVYRSRLKDIMRGRPPRTVQVTRALFRNMTGRSARFGQIGLPLDESQSPFGRGILVSPYEGDVEPLLRVYTETQGQPEQPHLLHANLPHSILKLIATGCAQTPAEILSFLDDSLSGQWMNRPAAEQVRFEASDLSSIMQQLEQQGFVTCKGHRLQVTSLGLVAARSGVQPETLEYLRGYLQEAETFLTLEVLLVLALSPDCQLQHLPVTLAEWRSHRYLNELYRRLELQGESERPCLLRLIEEGDASSQAFEGAVKKALLMADWISPLPTLEIERRYRALSGQIEKLADTFSWVADCLAEAGVIERKASELIQEIENLARQLRSGLPSAALGLTPLYARGLNRTSLLQLMEKNLATVDEVEQCPRTTLEECLGKALTRLLYQQEAWQDQPEAKAIARETEVSAYPPAREGEIRLGGVEGLALSRARPDRMLLQGKTIELTAREFDLLWALAEQAGDCVSYEDLLNQVWREEAVEQQQISFHKSRILKKVRQVCGSADALPLRTIRGRGLVLEIRK